MSQMAVGEVAAASVAARPKQRRARLNPWRVVLPVAIVLLVLAIWEAVAKTGWVPAYALPAPTTIIGKAVSERDTLLSAAGTTGAEMLLGYLAAIVIGFAIAALMVQVSVVEQGLYPLLITSQVVPVLAIAPLLIIWFGFGVAPKIIVVFVFCFFPVVLTSVAGLRSVERDMLMLMTSLGASGWQKFWRVRFPACLPSLFTGLKQAAVYSAIGAVTAEWVGADNGLGQVMINQASFLQTQTVFAAILWLTVMALILFGAVNVIERIVLRWYFMTKG